MKFGHVGYWVLRYAGGQTYRQTDKHAGNADRNTSRPLPDSEVIRANVECCEQEL